MKSFKETSELITLLEGRGLKIDEPDGAEFLHDFNYYRFTGYSRQFQRNPRAAENDYDLGTTLSEIRSIIRLDADLRRLLGTALTAVELSVRARFAHEAGRVYGGHAFYLDPSNYLGITRDLDRLITTMYSDLQRAKSPTIDRYASDNDYGNVPIWVAVELLPFGTIAKMMMYLSDDIPARRVAESYSLSWEGFTSTIHAFSVLRNQCAHHGQIWHRRPNIQTPVLKKLRPRGVRYDHQGGYPAIIMLKRYLKEITAGGEWASKIDDLLNSSQILRHGVMEPFAK